MYTALVLLSTAQMTSFMANINNVELVIPPCLSPLLISHISDCKLFFRTKLLLLSYTFLTSALNFYLIFLRFSPFHIPDCRTLAKVFSKLKKKTGILKNDPIPIQKHI